MKTQLRSSVVFACGAPHALLAGFVIAYVKDTEIMVFMSTAPSTWKELQDFATQLLNQMGYHAISPCTIDTVRGKVEVDILVDCPDVFVKRQYDGNI